MSLVTAPAGSSVSTRSSVDLVGTFRIAAGACDPVTRTVKGSWFRLIYPGGNTKTGYFFENTASACYEKSYTVVSPGGQGGLATGTYQPGPRRAFAENGDARAGAVIRPVPFATVDLSISTQATDPQTGHPVPAPSIVDAGGRLSGNLEAVSAAWRGIYMNQGSPKPGGRRPGLTTPVSGTYNARTHAFVLHWTSKIVGGPFTGFIADWHLIGRFAPTS